MAVLGLLLGPFALWFALITKWARRGRLKNAAIPLLLIAALGCLVYLMLFFLPVRHEYLILVYLLGIALSTILILRIGGTQLFHFIPGISGGGPAPSEKSLWDCGLAAFLLVFPLAYLGGLIRSLGELQILSVQWPSRVYFEALLWAIGSLPLAAGLGWVLFRSRLQIRLRTLLTFFAGLVCIAFWLVLWENLDNQVLNWTWGKLREPLLFQPWVEERFRAWVKWVFCGTGSALALFYLVLSPTAPVLLRRCVFLGMPSALAYLNLLFLLGDWNYYLGALQSTLLREQHLRGYAWLAACKTSRVPHAFRTPYDLEELAEYHYQEKDTAGAIDLWKKMSVELSQRPYASLLKRRADHYLTHLNGRGGANDSDSRANTDLPLRLIRPSQYLDANWYALLSAIGYLRPTWSELTLKKKLLALSPDLRMNLPALNGIPVLRSVLDGLGIPHRVAFCDAERLKGSLKSGLVPFLNVSGSWTAVSGYDDRRDAFVLYRYPEQYEQNPWWGAPQLDMLNNSEESGVPAPANARVPVKSSLPASELATALHDIGGVAVILGDSNGITRAEDRAAFLVELGDGYYQEQENDRAAAEAYAEAEKAFPNDYVATRMLYLKRRWEFRHLDAGDYSHLFEKPGHPDWFSKLEWEDARHRELIAKIWQGQMGQYLLLNWVAPIPAQGAPLFSERLDSAVHAYSVLRELQPAQAYYLDTLAALAHRAGHYDRELEYLDTLATYNPFGDQDIQFRIAWSAYLDGRFANVKKALKRCRLYRFEAKYELMEGAVACHEGHFRRGRKLLELSLKMDKANGHVHREWETCREQGDGKPYMREWVERTR